MADAPESSTGWVDLDRYKKGALTTRQLAWKLLKQTRNPEYVAARYGFPVDVMRKALEKIPHEKTIVTRKELQRDTAAKNKSEFESVDAILQKEIGGVQVANSEEKK